MLSGRRLWATLGQYKGIVVRGVSELPPVATTPPDQPGGIVWDTLGRPVVQTLVVYFFNFGPPVGTAAPLKDATTEITNSHGPPDVSAFWTGSGLVAGLHLDARLYYTGDVFFPWSLDLTINNVTETVRLTGGWVSSRLNSVGQNVFAASHDYSSETPNPHLLCGVLAVNLVEVQSGT